MNKFLASSIAALAVGILASQAYAADLGGNLKDDASTPEIGRAAFVGLGVGIQGGGQFTNIALTDSGDKFDGIGADGLVGGLHAEYLFAMGRFRVGPYAEGGFSNVNTSINFGGGDVDLVTQDYYFGGGVKAGIVVYGSSLVYARAGYEWAQWSSDLADEKADVGSLVVGGGIDTMIAHNISIGLSADYIVPLTVDVNGQDISDLLADSESLRVLARITYRQ